MLWKPIIAASLLAGVLAASFVASAATAVAQAGTAWNEHPNSRVRLVAADDGMIGVELQLGPGWKTYWRMPGDAGVPPTFEWAGSQNASDFEVFYPAPISMPDQGGTAVGYKGSVIFPVRFKRPDVGQPAKIALEFSYGVCKDVCIPIDSKLSMTATGDPSIQGGIEFMKALVSVPRPVTDAVKQAPSLLKTIFDLTGPKPHITFTTRGADDVFVEAPDNLFVPLTQRTVGKDGFATYVVDLSKSPDVKDLIGKSLRVTVTSATVGSIETMVPLK